MIVTWSKPLAQGQFVLVVVDGNVEAHNKCKTAKSLSGQAKWYKYKTMKTPANRENSGELKEIAIGGYVDGAVVIDGHGT